MVNSAFYHFYQFGFGKMRTSFGWRSVHAEQYADKRKCVEKNCDIPYSACHTLALLGWGSHEEVLYQVSELLPVSCVSETGISDYQTPRKCEANKKQTASEMCTRKAETHPLQSTETNRKTTNRRRRAAIAIDKQAVELLCKTLKLILCSYTENFWISQYKQTKEVRIYLSQSVIC